LNASHNTEAFVGAWWKNQFKIPYYKQDAEGFFTIKAKGWHQLREFAVVENKCQLVLQRWQAGIVHFTAVQAFPLELIYMKQW
jgi:hypothetical protein